MAISGFKPAFAAQKERRQWPRGPGLALALRDAIKLPSIVAIGCVFQLLLCAIIPLRWACVPPLVYTILAIITTIQQIYSPNSNSFLDGVISNRVTSQFPDPTTGEFGKQPSSHGFVLFKIGVQLNHPLGFASPHVREIGAFMDTLRADLEASRDRYGLIDISNWQGTERASNNTMLLNCYFRSIDGIHRLAHDDTHRQAWKYWETHKPSHIGIYHETYIVPSGGYESVYVNARPILSARMEVEVTGDGESDSGYEDSNSGESQPEQSEKTVPPSESRFQNVLVSADTPKLKSFYGRLGRNERGEPVESNAFALDGVMLREE